MVNDISKISSPLISPKNIESITKGSPVSGLSPGSLATQTGAVSQTSLNAVFPNNMQSLLLQLLGPVVADKMLFSKNYFRKKTNEMKGKTKKYAEKDKKYAEISKLFDEIDENNDLFEGYFLSNVQS